jgi:uncharacterized surface protein with fasciclin (FAS1) repeats
MRKRLLLYPAIASLLILLLIVPAAAAQFAPAVFVIDQDVVDNTVTVTRVTTNAPGWIVIHADDNGAPGPILGHSPVPSGITADVVVTIDPAGLTDTLWAMVHVDEGVADEYEFPGADVPLEIDGAIVMDSFAVGEVAQSIAGVAAETPDLSTLVQAVEAAGLTGTLQTDGPFTLFAPTNDAFAALPEGALDELLADPEQLAQVLLYHVVPGTVMAADISDGMEAETAQGDIVTFGMADGVVRVNDAAVIAPDLSAYNGVIHIIDGVLLPPAPEEAPAEEAAAEEAAAEEAPTPTVTVSDQESDGATVTVANVVAAQDGWMVIHLDDSGAPGPVLGQTAVTAGENADVVVTLDEPLSGETALWAMLHVDEGDAGVYEFPGPDGPVLVDDQIVMAPFTISVAEMAEEAVAASAPMTDTETMTDTAEMTEAAAMTDTETMTDTAAMTETEAMTDTADMTDTAAMTETEMADVTPSVTVIDQGSTGTNVAVIQAVAAQAGWMVIHADNDGAPGPVLGHASLPAGTTDNIIVTLDEPISGEVKLWAMLHVDEGEAGVYEFPGPDAPVTLDGAVVMEPFTAIVTGGEAAAEATPTPVEEEPADAAAEATPTPVEEEPADAVAEATPTPVEEEPAGDTMEDTAAAPDLLPQTGFATGAATGHLPVVFLVIAALFGSAVIMRRRN